MATVRRFRRAALALPTVLALVPAAGGCAGAGGARQPGPAGWHDDTAAAVGRPVTAAGVTAVTALATGGGLRTLVLDTAGGRRLWARPAAIAGRPVVMGVAPPAVVAAPSGTVVVSVEPRGGAAVVVVARDAGTGRRRWSRPVSSTFGPQACGDAVCVTESTARADASLAVLDPATGAVRWRTPGIGEVEWADDRRVVLFRMAARPLVEARDAATGRRLWAFPVATALGRAVDLSGGWSFGVLDDVLVGYVGPYTARSGRRSAFGFFALRLHDGALQWARRRLLRLYPGANPAVAPIARAPDAGGRPGAFVQLDPRTGRSIAQVPVPGTPPAGWWPAFPPDLSAVGILTPGHPGRAYDLRTGRPLAGHVRVWSRCAVPSPPPVTGRPGLHPPVAVCAYDVATGRRIGSGDPPPGWYTGATDGWRMWRDERGGLHARHDAAGTTPGMDG